MLNLAGWLTVASARWQTIPERGMVRSCKTFKFCWTPTVSLERLIVLGAVLGAVNLVHL